MPIGPSPCIVRSFAVPGVWVPGLGLCCLCSIRAWQNNGEKCEKVLTQAHVWTANWSHLACQLGLGLLLLGWNVNVSSQPLCVSLQLAETSCANSSTSTLCRMARIFFPGVGQCWLMCTTSLTRMWLINWVNQNSNSKLGCSRNYSAIAMSLGMAGAWVFSLSCCWMMHLSVALSLWSVISPLMILQ